MSQTKLTRKAQCVLFLTIAAALPAAAADDTAARLGRAGAVLNTVMDSGRGIRPEQIANADCIAVIPGFKKGAAVVGIGYGRGFVSCRSGNGWSAPGAITLESGSLGVQLGGEKIDIVILSLDKERRAKLLSDRFTIGSDASAAWGNGKSAHEDPNAKILFFGHTKRSVRWDRRGPIRGVVQIAHLAESNIRVSVFLRRARPMFGAGRRRSSL